MRKTMAHADDPNISLPTRKGLFHPHVSKSLDGATITAEAADFLGHESVTVATIGGAVMAHNCPLDSNAFRHLVAAARRFIAR